ncbi:MAG TPA: Na/Pi symporter, partial [Candidatus Deferrimicrobium sp.]|nr:Na/Pi symporter [Candidatus Deferrimicrobium sp.]
MNSVSILFRIFGGITLFLFGIRLISEQSQKFGRQWMRKTLANSSNEVPRSLFNGFRMAWAMQSASGVLSFIMGISESMIIVLPAALAMGLGANLGTVFTAWLLAVKWNAVAFLIVGFGILGILFGKSERTKVLAYLLLGTGFLFLGMESMKIGFAPLRNSEGIMLLISKLNGTDLFSVFQGMILGGILSALFGSRIAVTGLVIAVGSHGVLNFPGCASIILGVNLGTIARIHSIDVPINYISNGVKQVKLGLSLLNGLGILVIVPLFFGLVRLIDGFIPGTTNEG